jgi:hypothetical protein
MLDLAEPRIVTCHQPTYLPWAGLFHKLSLADDFVVMDTVPWSRAGWQNRNRIKGAHGPHWLTVPLPARGRRSGPLRDVAIDVGANGDWQRRHWESLRVSYGRAAFWRDYAPALEDVYLRREWTGLVDLNLALIGRLITLLCIDVRVVRAGELNATGHKSRLVLDQCRRASATVYVSGVCGRNYLIEPEFTAAGVSIFYQQYRAPVYEQRFGAFVPNLSVVDLLFNVGADSTAALLERNVHRVTILDALDLAGHPAVMQTVTGPDGVSDSVAVREPAPRLPPPDRADRGAVLEIS